MHLLRGSIAVFGMVCFSKGIMGVEGMTALAIALFSGLSCGIASYAGSQDGHRSA